MNKLSRNLDTEESRQYWTFVEKTAAKVDAWPTWKQVDVDGELGGLAVFRNRKPDGGEKGRQIHAD